MELWGSRSCGILRQDSGYNDLGDRVMDNEQLTPEELSKYGRYMAAQRRVVEGVCEVCGKQFSGTAKRRYCSNRCAVKAHRQRKAQAQLQDNV